MRTIKDESLREFFSSNSDMKEIILSFYFGNSNKLQYLYNQFYSTNDIEIVAMHFDKCHKTQWLCNTIVKIRPYKFCMVPELMKTPEMSLQTVKRIPRFIPLVPREILTFDFYKQMIEYYPELVFQTYWGLNHLDRFETWKIAILNDPSLILQMSSIQNIHELWQIAVILDTRLLVHMNHSYYSREFCISLIKLSPSMIEMFPSRYQTLEMYELAVMTDPKIISKIPQSHLTMELCMSIVSRDITMMDKLPWKQIF